LPIARIRPGRFQPRRYFDEASIEELAASIRSHGMLQPILVRPLDGQAEIYEIVAGERRWRAAQRAELHDVPVVIQALSDSQSLEIGLIENLQRQDLGALEEAEGYQRLIDEFGHSHAELGQLLGKSRSHVANMLRLLALPPSVRTLVEAGALSAGHARALLTAPNPEALARTAAERGLSVRETERLAGNAKAARKAPGKAGKAGGARKHADLLALERDLTERLGLKVTIESRGQAGAVTIAYRTIDQLDDVIARLSSS
jgi:ParB family chromosome partitioning protein